MLHTVISLPAPCGSQAHAKRDVGKERPVIQQSRLPLQPVHGHRHPGPRETLGQGSGNETFTEYIHKP